jgi:hypothetical protein
MATRTNQKSSAGVPFSQIPHRLLPHAPRETVHEQSAIQVIHLMLDAACQQALGLDDDWLTQAIDAARFGVVRPPQRIPHPGDGQASFTVFLLTLDGLVIGLTRCST